MSETTLNAFTHVAVYARVSSDQPVQQQTIESQISALRERIAADGFSLPDELCSH